MIRDFYYPTWAKIVFFGFIGLWLAWLYLLGGEIEITWSKKSSSKFRLT